MKTIQLEHIVKKPTQKLLYQSLKTVPVEPENGSLCFYATNAYLPAGFSSEDEFKQYFNECRLKNVIPYSFIRFEYRDTAKLFMPEHKGGVLMTPPHLRDKVRTVNELFRKGGRVEQVAFIFERGSWPTFIEDELDGYNKERYSIGVFQLTLTTKQVSDFFGSRTTADATLCHEPLNKDLKLRLGYETSRKERKELREWFERLK